MKTLRSLSFTSPGRINLLGEHIDYCGGLVLPATIDLGIHFYVQRRVTPGITFEHLDLHQYGEVSLSCLADFPWLRYWISALEVAPNVFDKNDLGIHISISSNLPKGAGLSSSSALTCGFIYALYKMYELSLSPSDIIQWAVQSEHGTGVKGGQMDQTAIFYARKNAFMALDCSKGLWTYHKFQTKNVALVLIDSLTQHELMDSEYNDRRQLCDKATFLLTVENGQSFLDTSPKELEEKLSHWSVDKREKIGFILQEQKRSKRALSALQANDWTLLGNIMTDTHWGLSKQYQVSTPRLDQMVHAFLEEESVLGCRMMGGGFGGCVLLLVSMDSWDERRLHMHLKNQIKMKLGFTPHVYKTVLSNGLFSDDT